MMADDSEFDDSKKSDNNKHSSEELAIENLLRNEDGRSIAYQFLNQCGTFNNIFNADPIQHAYNSGQRNAGLMFETMLKDAAPEFYFMMMKENS